MPRRYTVHATFGSVSAAKDVLRLSGVRGVTRLVEVHVTNEADETSEMLPFAIARASTAGTGTAVDPVNLDPNDRSASFTCAYNLSSATTKTQVIHRESCNILSGFHYVPTPEARPLIPAAGNLAIYLDAAPTNSQTLAVNAVVEEEG